MLASCHQIKVATKLIIYGREKGWIILEILTQVWIDYANAKNAYIHEQGYYLCTSKNFYSQSINRQCWTQIQQFRNKQVLFFFFKDTVCRKRTVPLNKHAYVNPIFFKKCFRKNWAVLRPPTGHRTFLLSAVCGSTRHLGDAACLYFFLGVLRATATQSIKTMSRFSWPCLRGKDSKRLILVVWLLGSLQSGHEPNRPIYSR